MARPPVEWPIPAYVLELRERLIVTCRVPAVALGRLPLSPILAQTVGGVGVVSFCLSRGRCLKSVGGVAVLASEFEIAELLAPVVWHAACRAPLQGMCAFQLRASSHGLARLARAALHLETGTFTKGSLRISALRQVTEPEWPQDSVFCSAERAEGLLLHPEWYFAPDRDGSRVRATPVHHYARSTTVVQVEGTPTELIAQQLHLDVDDVAVDHALLQKRCTHTYSFPPETIVRPRTSTVPWRSLPCQFTAKLAA